MDRFRYTVGGRVTGTQSFTLRCKAIYPDGVKTLDIPVTIQEDLPDPAFTLQAPATWDGRETIEVVPQIANLQALQAKGVGDLTYDWTVPPLVAVQEVAPGKLILKRARNSGQLLVTATVSNGGAPVRQTVEIAVKEPAKDPWVRRTPDKDEKPVDNQFYARDDRNEGTLFYTRNAGSARRLGIPQTLCRRQAHPDREPAPEGRQGRTRSPFRSRRGW